MIRELDRIVLTAAVPGEDLESGDVGTVVHVYADRKAYESSSQRSTGTVATVEAVNVRPVGPRELTQPRELSAADRYADVMR
jgi:hypothetical protein